MVNLKVFIALVLFPAWAMADAPPSDLPGNRLPSATEMAALRAGEILIESTQLEESGGAARVQAIFHLDAAELWAVIGSCEENFRFVQGLRDCEVMDESLRTARTRQQVKKHLLSPRLDYVFQTTREPYEWIFIHLESGDLRELVGSWRFNPLPGGAGLLVSHEIRVRPSMPVPRWLIRRTVRRDIGDMVACLRWVAGGSGEAEQQARDRERCPGES